MCFLRWLTRVYKEPMQRKLVLWIAAGVVAGAGLWLWNLCARANSTSFLPHQAPAEWILYPKPPILHLQGVVELPATFRRIVIAPGGGQSASLSLRALRRCAVTINGREVPLPDSSGDWKRAQQIEVGPFLKAGENLVCVTVWNQTGPPALWLSMHGPGIEVPSDTSWEASYAGSVWRQAQLASSPLPVGRGNAAAGGESTLVSFGRGWRMLVLYFFLAAGLVLVGRWWLQTTSYGGNLQVDAALVSTSLDHGIVEPASSPRPSPPKEERENGHEGGRCEIPVRTSKLFGSIGKRRSIFSSLAMNPASVLLVFLGLGWFILFTHNLGRLPRDAGFDAAGHMEYVNYIQTHRSLPSPEQGWEMHQPPLYYLLAAGVLTPFNLSTDSYEGVAALRLLALGIALAHLFLIFLSLRLLFPDSVPQQLAGLALGGLLPMHIYLSHYITNETLAACLMSATVYFLLLLLKRKQASAGIYVAAGLCLGLALLTKVTAVVLGPFVIAVLARCAMRMRSGNAPETGARGWWFHPLLAASVCLAVCGWRYVETWQRFGHFLFAETRWGFGVGWWQDPGFQTSGYFARFGRSLFDPMYSGFSSFWDGLYSTLWGDGLCAGAASLAFRSPWNYDLMGAGFLLALVPSAILLLGAGIAIATVLRKMDVCWMLLLSFGAAMLLAILHLNLSVPTYAEAKAFFGLCAMIPACALVAAGYGALVRRSKAAGIAAAFAVSVWGFNSYSTYWIRGDTAETHTAIGRAFMRDGNFKVAVDYLTAAIGANPRSAEPRAFLVESLLALQQTSEAMVAAQHATNDLPGSARCHLALASVMEKQGQTAAAAASTALAVQLEPDNPDARLQLATRLFQLGRKAEAVGACREALRLMPGDPDAHVLLASALVAKSKQPDASETLSGDEPLFRPIPNASLRDILMAEAINHYRIAVALAPSSPGVLRNLAWILATDPRAELRDGKQAVLLAEKACNLTHPEDPRMLGTLAAAQAEAANYELAIQTAEKAMTLAESAGLPEILAATRQMLDSFRNHHPHREER
jgi:tetratricopeptide (TPR) repeat protein